jgi:LysR family transcriptional regulator, hydrogen peroxide-inducible genes activator
VAVADTLGFHRAAERCGVSQPTLSSQIQKLEDVLGVRIFERDRRRVIVTLPGQAILAHARTVLIGLDDLLRVARQTTDPLAGTLRLGVIPTVAPYLLPWVTPAIAKRWPKLRLALVEEKTEALLGALRAGELDAALLAMTPGMDDLVVALVHEDPFVAAVPSAHPLAKQKTVAIAELEREPVLLLDEGHCLRDQALALCRRPLTSATDLRATSLATLVQMVSVGAGVTLLPSIAVEVENRRGQLAIRPLAGRARGRTICLAWRQTTPLGDALRELARTMASSL